MSTRHADTSPEENKLENNPDDPNTTNENTVTTKYSTGSSVDAESAPAEFTKGVTPDDFTETNDATADVDPPQAEDKPKYSDHISTGQIEAIPNHPSRNQSHNGETEFNTKGNYHSENRFLERANPDAEDQMPSSLQQAWKEGIRVGIDHFDKENFYTYKYARYHEPTNIIMLMNDNGMIETVIVKFNDVISVTTDHLLKCGDPDCGRLYNKTSDSECCHWCGYDKNTGRNKREAELLPQNG